MAVGWLFVEFIEFIVEYHVDEFDDIRWQWFGYSSNKSLIGG
jgi:hypothetical protein